MIWLSSPNEDVVGMSEHEMAALFPHLFSSSENDTVNDDSKEQADAA